MLPLWARRPHRRKTCGLELYCEAAADAATPKPWPNSVSATAHGLGVTRKDFQNGDAYFTEAMLHFNKASELGSLEAGGNVSVLYLNGQGTAPNPKKAAELFEKGAHDGDPYCMMLLAQCFEIGKGIPRNSLKANEWYRKAAAAGNKSAMDWCGSKLDTVLTPASKRNRRPAATRFPLPGCHPLSNNPPTSAMKLGTLQTVALATSISLLVTACENMTPGENAAVFGTSAGLLAGGIARAAGASTGESIAIGAAAGAVVAVTTYIIAKHQASERQRRIAEERARVYYAHLAPEKKEALKKKKVRYIAVDTEKNEKTSPKAKKAIMIWDTQSETVVGNNVYDVQSPPSVGSTAKFETYSAEYVGSGS